MEFVETANAPKPIGPYSQATASGGLLFVSGMLGVDPATDQMVAGGISEQTNRTIENVKAVLEQAGSSLQKVLKTTVYLGDRSYFKEMNDAYASSFGGHRPARVTIVCIFPRDDILVEIDAIAER